MCNGVSSHVCDWEESVISDTDNVEEESSSGTDMSISVSRVSVAADTTGGWRSDNLSRGASSSEQLSSSSEFVILSGTLFVPPRKSPNPCVVCRLFLLTGPPIVVDVGS